MSYFDSNSDRSIHTNTSSLIPSISIPKNFSVPFAIQHGYFRCVRYLLELLHDPNERDTQLHTPLILCSYIDNDKWSLSIAQNLLEKGAKIALTDNARRNAMHHACALQRIHLVKLYLSCLEFDIESKDCDGNTYLHYAAITGNCEIADLLVGITDKMGVHLDQHVNREGCSAAVLALRYGHIECANQITHRDWDEFFVVPRPLSLYETPSATDINHNQTETTTKAKQKNKTFHNSSTSKHDVRPSKLSFGLLKIIFNENDTKYSTHFAKLCDKGKQNPYHYHRHVRRKNQNISSTINKPDQPKSTVPNGTQNSSMETITTEIQSSKKREEHKINLDRKEKVHTNTNGLPPRIPSSMQQHASTRDSSLLNERTKSKIQTPIIQQQHLDSPTNRCQSTTPSLLESTRIKNNLQRPTTAVPNRHKNLNNTLDTPSRLNSHKISSPTSTCKKIKRKSSLNIRPKSASYIPKLLQQQHTNLTFEASTYSKTLFAGRPLSAVLQHHHCRSPVQQIVDPSCSIREARGAASRYNNPEELFGIKPEDLFGSPEGPSKMISQRDTLLKRNNLQTPHQYMYQQDVDKLVDLYATQHTSSYRPAVVPPSKIQANAGLKPGEKHRKLTTSKGSITNTRTPPNFRRSTLATLNISRRFSDARLSVMKSVHT